MPFCNVIIYSYHYLLDPKIAERVSRELSKDCIIVFDEAHNIGGTFGMVMLTSDNVCIESLSIDLFDDTLKKATRSVNSLEKKIEKYNLNLRPLISQYEEDGCCEVTE
jgi:DNA excision repair protein ERCC-2